MRRLAALSLGLPIAALVLAGAARADVFGSFSLASAGPLQQADYAHDAAISGNGRYVVFDGSFGGRSGVWRRDLQSGELLAVAAGQMGAPSGSAQLPSISDDGRYVSFTTTAQLSSGDMNLGPDVYVRDMAVAETTAGAFTLASAADGSQAGLTYVYGSNPVTEEQNLGSVASGRTALSSDGRSVAFVTTAVSNLSRPGAMDTPALQVAVRHLDSDRTQLVSGQYDPATGATKIDPETASAVPVSAGEGNATYGAVDTGAATPRAYELALPYEYTTPIGASISGDGSTVAWMATNVGQQAPLLPDETVQPKYSEPLWRRIADGPTAPTRRITGGSDPLAPACRASGERVLPQGPSASDPCQGPFRVEPAEGLVSGVGDIVPQLSSDGYEVAFLSSAPLVALGADFGAGVSERNSDLYLANMHEGLTRDQALRALTELASNEQTDLATDGRIVDLAIAPNGSEIAFTTKRTQFPLGSPAYISAPAPVAGMVELFDVDTADDTVTRVTGGFEGGAAEHPHPPAEAGKDPYEHPGDGALSPSFSDDGNVLAFSSTASNLVYGDGNTPPLGTPGFDGSDAFVVNRKLFSPTPTAGYLTAAPASPLGAPVWRLGLTALSRADGSVLLYATVPAAGALRGAAQATVRVLLAAPRRAARRPARPRTTVATRTVAARSQQAGASGVVTLALKLGKRYAGLAGKRGGLSAGVTVTFAVAHRPSLRQSVQVTFLRKAGRHAARKGEQASRGRRASGARRSAS